MAWRSPSDINATKGITEVTNYLNDVTLNWFGNMLVIAVWVIFLFGYLRAKGDDDFIGAFAVASYVTFVLTTLLWIVGMVSGVTFGIVIGVTLISSVALFIDKKR
jgi:uncharacterized membrane protein